MASAAAAFDAHPKFTVRTYKQFRLMLPLAKLYPARGVRGLFSNIKRGHREPPNFNRFLSITLFNSYMRWCPFAYAAESEVGVV